MGRLIALAMALALGALIAWGAEQPSRVRGADAPATRFSAHRAFADVEAIARTPHPVGSPANRQVRDHLLSRMAALGLSPQLRPGRAFETRRTGVGGGYVENIVGVLPGRDRTVPALALMAHYDSVPASPGAADDAAGVAAILETMRVLALHGQPARDVMVVFTDGEEAGLLGARAFFQRDPLARRIGFLVNLEARGSTGRVQMFETGPGNGGDIALFRRATVRPASSSLAVLVYRLMPNSTDFTLARTAGVPGFNFAFLGRQFDYHSPTATPANLDLGTLQDMGDQLSGVAIGVGDGWRLPPRAPDAVYSHIFGDLIVSYPPSAGWLILAVATGLLAAAAMRARRRFTLRWRDIGRGAAALIFAVVGAAAVLHLARLAAGAGFDAMGQRWLLAQSVTWEVTLSLLGVGFLLLAAASLARGRWLAALVPLAAGAGASAFGGFDAPGLILGAVAALAGAIACARPVSRAAGWAGVLALGLLTAVAAQVFAPTAAFILAWPLLLASLVAALTTLALQPARISLAVLSIAAAAGIGWLGGFAHGAFLGLDLPELLTLPLLPAALLLWPLAQPDEGAPPARLVGPLLLAAGAVLVVVVRLDAPWSARHPEVAEVSYLVDQDAGRAWRVNASPDSTAWTQSVLGAGAAPFAHWAAPRAIEAAAAPVPGEAAPTLTFARQTGGDVVMTALPPVGARRLTLQLRSDTLAMIVAVAGLPARLPLKPGVWTTVRWEADPQALILTLRPAGPGKLAVRYVTTFERWPASAPPLPRRPADVMAWDLSDATLVAGTRGYAW